MYRKMGIKLTTKYSLNFGLPKRPKKRIKFIIIHYTGMKKETAAIERLLSPKSKVSSHYYIKKNGNILNLVPDLYEAWHAGTSSWKNLTSLNKHSIGIEMTNPGHYHRYDNFSIKQILSLKRLLKYLMKKYKIGYKCILGHSDISPDRKKDPGFTDPRKTNDRVQKKQRRDVDALEKPNPPRLTLASCSAELFPSLSLVPERNKKTLYPLRFPFKPIVNPHLKP